MRDAQAIVNQLLEAHQPDENIDWEADAQDPDEVADPESAFKRSMTFPGVPAEGEPLLRIEAMRAQAKVHAGGYTQSGGFYRRSYMQHGGSGPQHFTFPHGTKIKKLDWRTFAVFWEDGSVGIQLHGTVIIKRTPDGNYSINSGGWTTVSTLGVLAEYLPFGWTLGHRRKTGKGNWMNMANDIGSFRDPYGRIIEFKDGDRILADGTLVPQKPPQYRNVKKKSDSPQTQ